MRIGFAFCGSFCTYAAVFPVLEKLSEQHEIIPIFSAVSSSTDTRFGKATDHLTHAARICLHKPLCTIEEVEPIGPKKLLDALIIAPCTGNTLAKLSHGIADTSVTMAAKSHLRNGRPVIIAVSTNDGLAVAAENIGKLLARKNYYFVPFSQDDPTEKPTSLVADFSQIPDCLDYAIKGIQIQPILKSLRIKP